MKLNPSIKNMSNEYIFFTDQTALTFRICLVFSWLWSVMARMRYKYSHVTSEVDETVSLPFQKQPSLMLECHQFIRNPLGWKGPRHYSLNTHQRYSAVTAHYCGTRWHSWLRHSATSRKVAGSTPDAVIGIFYWHNPSGRTMALGFTQPPTEMSTRNISWGAKAAGT
jgi:hypothetical protein